MKSHAFIRENIPHALRHRKSDGKLALHRSSEMTAICGLGNTWAGHMGCMWSAVVQCLKHMTDDRKVACSNPAGATSKLWQRDTKRCWSFLSCVYALSWTPYSRLENDNSWNKSLLC